MVTTVVGLTLLLVSAAVFAITTPTARIAGDSRELHHLDETLRIATVVRANVANAVHFDSLERNLGIDIGDSKVASIETTRSALESLAGLLSTDIGPDLTASDLTWSIALVGEFERLPSLAGPDHSHKAISFFDAGVTGIESTGKLMMTNGTLWVEVVTSAGPAWVEARHVTPGRPERSEADRASMIEVRDEVIDRIRHGEPFTHLISGRGLYMEMSDEIAAVPQSRVDPLLTHILRDGDEESRQLIDALSMRIVKDDAIEVPVELRNFEYLIVGGRLEPLGALLRTWHRQAPRAGRRLTRPSPRRSLIRDERT
ncbi:MAG: hypothetical protein OEQ47_13155 [Acidimicrobiia bacterium]|nr:hypothetical protein [Acidimicrobiia bacterium]